MTAALRAKNDDEWFPSPVPPGLDGLDYGTAAAYLAFQRVMDAHQRLVIQHMTQRVMYPGQVILLRMLTAGDGMAQRDIAQAMRISRARVTHLVQALEELGAVHRERDSRDQRIIRVYLTELGRGLEREKGSARVDEINHIFGSLALEDQTGLQRLLGLLGERIAELLQ